VREDRFFVYYRNALKSAALSASPVEAGFLTADLAHPFLSRRLAFSAPEALIAASWGAGVFLDALALADCRFTQARVVAAAGPGEPLLDRWWYPQGAGVNIFRFPGALPCGELRLELYGDEPLSAGYLFAGMGTAFPRFSPGPGMSLEVSGGAERTARGQVYGLSWPAAETFSASFPGVGAADRRAMEDYIRAVGYAVPHVIEPYDPGVYPPLYAALTEAGSFKKRSENGFFYDTSMAWKEAF
jgi:hypothetical protein